MFSKLHTNIGLVFCFLLWGCDPFHVQIDNTKHEITAYEATSLTIAQTPANSELLIMDWNIRFGGGRIPFYWDCYGDRTLMEEEEVEANMAAIVEEINRVNPDILFIQEIDIGSKRSVYMDQMQYILDQTSLNYGVYAPNWKADFIPSDGHGRMNTGIALFSRWQIKNPERIQLPLIEDQAATTRHFYLRRCYLQCKIEPGNGTEYAFLNLHASAWAQDDTKKRQLEIFKAALDSISGLGETFVAGGDFNNIPPGSTVLTNFEDALDCDPDFPPDDFTDQIDWMTPYYNTYPAAIPLVDYQVNNSKYYSYTADENGFWTRKLDHLFTNGTFVSGSGMIHQDSTSGGSATMPLSDHAPLTVKLKL